MNIQGSCHPAFRAVEEEFARNFAERGEVGAAVCVIVEGETVADLWGGVADRRSGGPWQRDTIGLLWSCTKGAVALCAHVLAARGQLDLDAPVARYWPEFGPPGSRWLGPAYGDPQSLQALVLKNNGGYYAGRAYESRAAHAAVLPSAGGIGNARALARMYAPLALGGNFAGVHLLDADAAVRAGVVHAASAEDAVMLIGLRFGLGFVKACDNRRAP